MSEPTKIEAGTTLTWSRSFSQYPSATWSLTYQLVSRAAVYPINATANADGVTFDVSVAFGATAGYEPGHYRLIGHVTGGSERHRVVDLAVEVTPDVTTGQPVDVRSQNRKILDAIQATIAGRATRDQQSQQIGGRAIQRHTLAELVQLENRYQWLVDREEGRATGVVTNVGARFSGVS